MTKTNQDIGFIITKINGGHFFTKVLSTIKKFADNNPFNQYVIFSSCVERIDINYLPILHLNQSKFFYGNIFLFDFMSILLTENFPNIHKRYFYAQNAPWSLNPQTNYSEWTKIFDSKNIDIIAENSFINDIYNICWKKPLCVAENFDYDKIKTIV